MKQNNYFPITGVIFEKLTRHVVGKAGTKNEGKEWDFKSIVLEIKYKDVNGNDKPTLIEVDFGTADIEHGFDVGDTVQIELQLIGRDPEKEGRIFNKCKAFYIRHPDLQINDTRNVAGESVYDKKRKEKALKEIPVVEDKDEEEDDLPF